MTDERHDERDDGGDDGDDEARQQQQDAEEAEEAARMEPRVMYEVARQEGEQELDRPASALFWSALAAGLSMGFALLAQALLRAPLPDEAWAPLVSRYGYAVGFVLVVLGRQQLFTENTLTAVVPFLSAPKLATFGKVMRLWGIVLLGNWVGTFLFAAVLAHAKVFDPAVEQHLGSIAAEAVAGAPLALFIKAIFAGWLIALMVWMLPSVTSKLVIVSLVTYFIALAGLAHVVAGSGDAFYAMLTGAITPARCFLGYLLPTLVGNVIGGVGLVAALNHAQVSPERPST